MVVSFHPKMSMTDDLSEFRQPFLDSRLGVTDPRADNSFSYNSHKKEPRLTERRSHSEDKEVLSVFVVTRAHAHWPPLRQRLSADFNMCFAARSRPAETGTTEE